MNSSAPESVKSCLSQKLKTPKTLSSRITKLRNWYHDGMNRQWRNENTAWTTGTPWDVIFEEMTYYIVPEMIIFTKPYLAGYYQAANTVTLCPNFWKMSLPERRAWFVREVMVNYVPQEILPGSLLAGSRFNIIASRCFNKKEWKKHRKKICGKKGARSRAQWFFQHGLGNVGSTSGHLIPSYETVLRIGWKGIYADIETRYQQFSKIEKQGSRGDQLRAMMLAATMASEVAKKCRKSCIEQLNHETDTERRLELETMADNLTRVPWEPANTFWEALQAIWLTHMLVISDENYIGGISFGRIDQYLYPFWERSIDSGMKREFGKELLRCFWIHANTAYDAIIRMGGRQGMVAGYGQLMTLSGLLRNGTDGTNDLTYALLEVADEMDPLLQPKLNVRIHRNTPDAFLDFLVDMVSRYQGSPFTLNFDERSMAGMLREGRLGGYSDIITKEIVYDYSPIGCLENTMGSMDRSGTADIHLNLYKPIELALNNGCNMLPAFDVTTNKFKSIKRYAPKTGIAEGLSTWELFYNAVEHQMRYCIKKAVEIYEDTDVLRTQFCPTPYLSCLVEGCVEKGIDVSGMGAKINFATIEGTAFATAIDALLAIKHIVYNKKICSLSKLRDTVINNWENSEVLRTIACLKSPKYGCDDDESDQLALDFMKLWTEEVWKYRVPSTNRPFRPGMLSWNTMIADAMVAPASPDGRKKGQFFSNALCPSNGADRQGLLANINSTGKVIGGKTIEGDGDYDSYTNLLPNGTSHTITLNPSSVNTPKHRDCIKALILGYAENGGTSLQINVIDETILREAQKDPNSYANLMVRITGYNAYFVNIGSELQNEVINRIVHGVV